ncbi:MAG: BatA domain-containing protein [Chloroflexi bacterium]|nr:BatA domain-containing protein [Chloroflexota bacterium]
MSFLSPAFFLLGALAAPILLLYMLKLRRREVQVSSTLLWQLLLRDREANAPWQKLRRKLLLILQLLILAALTLALARPFLPIPTVASGSVVVLLDASASMNAADVAPSRFEVARAQARRLIDGLSSGARITLILAGAQPQVLAAGESDRAELRRALDSARPTTGPADWNAAFALAAAGAGGAGSNRATVLVISDAEPAVYQARLSPAAGEGAVDAFATDDVAFAVYRPPLSGRALLVSPGNLFLEQALSVLPGLQPFRAPPGAGDHTGSPLLPADPFDLYVFDGVLPEALPPGDLLLVNPPPNDLFTVGGVFTGTAGVALAEGTLTRFLDWREVHVLRARQVQLPAWAEAAVTAPGGPLVFAGAQGGRRVAVITFDLHDSDLPLQVAFPILISNLVDYLAPSQALAAPDGLRPGQTLAILPGAGVTQVAVAAPDGSVFAAAPGENGVVFSQTGQ